MNIVVDAMGGDYAPENVIAGVIDAIKEFDVRITLVGQEDRIKDHLQKYTYPEDHIQIIHTDEVVGMHEPASTSIRQKKNSSITVGVGLLKDPQYHAFISAGNTGAVVAAATIKLGMIPGIDRPAIGLVIPQLTGFAFLMDVGANTDPKPLHMVQSAQMARVYATSVLNVANPRVGMLNIGEEAGKGGGSIKSLFKLLQENVDNFIGNVEANELFKGKADCIISDGFVGNVVIKVSQGLMESASLLIKREVKKSPLAILGALLMKTRLNQVKRYADYSEYGGAPLLGVDGIVMISHGRSSPKAIKNAIRAAKREVEHDILKKLKDAVN